MQHCSLPLRHEPPSAAKHVKMYLTRDFCLHALHGQSTCFRHKLGGRWLGTPVRSAGVAFDWFSRALVSLQIAGSKNSLMNSKHGDLLSRITIKMQILVSWLFFSDLFHEQSVWTTSEDKKLTNLHRFDQYWSSTFTQSIDFQNMPSELKLQIAMAIYSMLRRIYRQKPAIIVFTSINIRQKKFTRKFTSTQI